VQTPNVHQLEETYRQMMDEELLKLAEDLSSLTDPAKEALKAELYRRHLEEAKAPPPLAPAESANLDTPELRQLRETYSHMTDTEILRLASEMDSLADQAADVLYTEVCRRKLEEGVALEVAEVPPPFETETLPIESDTPSNLGEARSYKWGRFQGWALVAVGSLYATLAVFSTVYAFRSEGTAMTIGFLTAASLLVVTGVGLLKKRRYGLVLMYGSILLYPVSFLGGSKHLRLSAPPYQALPLVLEIMNLAFWCIPAIFYYPKRWKEFR
jgi:hypothetical protein